MQYTAQNIDVTKMEQGLKDKLRHEEDKIRKKISSEEAFLNGYTDAIYDVIDMLHCSNYEKSESNE